MSHTAPVPRIDHTALRRRLRQVQAMAEGEWLPSPCISVCRMNPNTQLCLGCLRDLNEIAEWANLDPATQRQVWRRVEQRLQALTA